MSIAGISTGSAIEPLRAILDAEPGRSAVLAVITGVEGPSYRPVGAMMAVIGADQVVGTLSSGCVEADIALKAQEALAGGPVCLRYGRGSAYFDIQLPCGGGMDVLLVPSPDPALLRAALACHARREAFTLEFAPAGRLCAVHASAVGERGAGAIWVTVQPELAFYVFGKGPEASTFATLAHSAGYELSLIHI